MTSADVLGLEALEFLLVAKFVGLSRVNSFSLNHYAMNLTIVCSFEETVIVTTLRS